MKSQKKQLSAALYIYLILTVLANLIIFVAFKPWTLEVGKSVFWFSYAFLMIALIIQIVGTILGKFEKGVQAVFLNIPLFHLSWMYLGISAVLTFLFMILVRFDVAVPFALAFILQCLVLGIYLIVFIVTLSHKNVVLDIENRAKSNVIALRLLATDVCAMAETAEEPAVKAALNELAESIKFSDPMTNEYVKDIDAQIRDLVAELEVDIEGKDYEVAMEKIKKTKVLVAKRKRTLIASK